MKKLHILISAIAMQCFITNTAEFSNRFEAKRRMDAITNQDPIEWPAVFNILDAAGNSLDVNAYATPNTRASLLEEAVLTKNLFAAKKLLTEHNADPNLQKDETKFTPLMFACFTRNPVMIELLIAHGANPYLRNARGQNSFDFVAGHDKLMGLLDTYKRNKKR